MRRFAAENRDKTRQIGVIAVKYNVSEIAFRRRFVADYVCLDAAVGFERCEFSELISPTVRLITTRWNLSNIS